MHHRQFRYYPGPFTAPRIMPQRPYFSRLPLLLALLGSMLLASGCSWFGGDEQDEEDDYITASEVYDSAKLSLANGNYQNAIRNYKLLTSRFPFGRYTEQANLELAYTYYKSFRHEEALASINRFLKTYPTHKHVDYAYYLRGLVNFYRDRTFLERFTPDLATTRDPQSARQAFLDFSELIGRFPDSRYRDDSRQRMVYLREKLAAHEMAVAKYYLRRDALVAAANRGKYIVETYQQTPYTADALALMATCYTRLGLSNLSDDAERVLAANYPDHPYVTGEAAGRAEGWLGWLWPFDGGREKEEAFYQTREEEQRAGKGFFRRLWPFGGKDEETPPET